MIKALSLFRLNTCSLSLSQKKKKKKKKKFFFKKYKKKKKKKKKKDDFELLIQSTKTDFDIIAVFESRLNHLRCQFTIPNYSYVL